MPRILLGACVGYLLSLIAISVLVTISPTHSDQAASGIILQPFEMVPWQEWFESWLFRLLFIFGTLGGLAGVRLFKGLPSWLALLAIIGLIVCMTAAAAKVFDQGKILYPWIILCFLILGGSLALSHEAPPGYSAVSRSNPSINSTPSFHIVLVFGLYLVIVILALKPASIADLSTWMTDPHAASYLIAPALDYLSPLARPSIDFETHYGLGLPWLFSWFLATDLETTHFRAAIFMIGLSIAFYAQIFWLCRWAFHSTALAFVVALLLLVAGFDGFSITVFSNLPARFAMAPIALWSAVRAAQSGAKPAHAGMAGAISGLAVSFQTDTGLMLVLAIVSLLLAALVVARKPLTTFIGYCAGLGVSLLLVAMGLAGVGWHVFLMPFRVIEPLLLYSGGFGGIKLQWDSNWSYFYNVLMPVLLTASLAYSLVRLRLGARKEALSPDQEKRALLLFLLSIFAFLALLKWVNRSIDVVWWLNSWPAIIVLVIWLQAAFRSICDRFGIMGVPQTALACFATLAFASTTLIDANRTIVHGLSRSPALRWQKYFLEQPGTGLRLARFLLGDGWNMNFPRQARLISEADSDFIRDRTSSGERVTVLSKYDWLYLTAARRPSALHWMPVYLTHTQTLSNRNLDDIRTARRIFMDRETSRATGYWGVPRLSDYQIHTKIEALLSECFSEIESTPRWSLMANHCDQVSQK